MDFAYLPYLVADGEEGDGHDDEDGEEEVEDEHGQIVGDASVGGKSVDSGNEGAGDNRYYQCADSE